MRIYRNAPSLNEIIVLPWSDCEITILPLTIHLHC
jgi:hypothetical protein